MTLQEKLAAQQAAIDAQNAAAAAGDPTAAAFNAMFKPGSYRDMTLPNGRSIQMLPTEKLHGYGHHTFQVRTAAPDYLALENSIRENGVKQPLLVRRHPSVTGDYEIIAGHRRWTAAKACGLKDIPCVIVELNDDDATILMAESNIQRPDWLPSEKAKTYAAHLEAVKQKSGIVSGSRTDLTSSTGSTRFRNDDEAAKTWGIAKDAFRMYLKLNDLTPQLLDAVDVGTITVKSGYQLAFLSAEEQTIVEEVLLVHGAGRKLPGSKGKEIREAAQDAGGLTVPLLERVLGIAHKDFDEPAERQISIKFSSCRLLKASTVRRALADPKVMEQIEQLLISYAHDKKLPLT